MKGEKKQNAQHWVAWLSQIAAVLVFAYETYKVHFKKQAITTIDYVVVICCVAVAFYFTQKQRKARGY